MDTRTSFFETFLSYGHGTIGAHIRLDSGDYRPDLNRNRRTNPKHCLPLRVWFDSGEWPTSCESGSTPSHSCWVASIKVPAIPLKLRPSSKLAREYKWRTAFRMAIGA